MSLSHVLLTSLLEQPSTGFELARRFDRSMGYFWNASHQQIYRELNQMLEKNWLSTIEDEHSSGRKKTYCVESAGRQELASWLLKSSKPTAIRDDLMVRLRAEAQLNSGKIYQELEQHLTAHKNTLALYQKIYAKDFEQLEQPNRVHFIHKKILQLGIQQELCWIEWLQEMLVELPSFD